jgi:putative salt-induced outer membrane protein YdiY
MSRKPLKVSVLSVMFAVLVMTGTKAAMAQKSVSTTIDDPLNFTGLACDTFEPIQFTGYVRTVYETTYNGNGSPDKLKISTNWEHVTGTTASGRLYKGKSNSKETIDLDGLPSQYKHNVTERWIGKGNVPDFVYRLRFVVKVDVNGNVTHIKDTEITECK